MVIDEPRYKDFSQEDRYLRIRHGMLKKNKKISLPLSPVELVIVSLFFATCSYRSLARYWCEGSSGNSILKTVSLVSKLQASADCAVKPAGENRDKTWQNMAK